MKKIIFFTLTCLVMLTTAHADFWALTPVNHSFEERDLGTEDNWSGSVLSWFDVDWTWEQTGTGLDGNGIPIPPDGLNWGGIGGTGASYIYQQIGTYTGSMGMEIDFYIGLRSGTDNGPIRAALWVGGDPQCRRRLHSLPAAKPGVRPNAGQWSNKCSPGRNFKLQHWSCRGPGGP